MKNNKSNDIVFNILEQIYANCPRGSYTRLNGALSQALTSCIAADLPFQRDTFRRVCDELGGGYWFGDSGGSAHGERFYNHAIECNHASAIQSFEQYAGRPGVLWEEDAGTPIRLHLGAQFTWKGYYVTVTSMRPDRLVACTYKDTGDIAHGIEVGATITDYSHTSRAGGVRNFVITTKERDGAGWKLRVKPAKADEGSHVVARRFTITYAEIKEMRRSEAKRVNAVIDAIAKCNPAKDAKALNKRVSEEHFRHFQLEKIQAAWRSRLKDASAEEKLAVDQQRIQAWRDGTNGVYLEIEDNLLRVKGDQVQCSNGNCVSLAAVRRALPVVLDHRTKNHGTFNLPLDHHTIKGITADGVTIGCTFVRWAEVERLQTTINKLP